ncbi:hypothetical protein MUK42_34209 [Musa troglodytarum]|uniref:Uncharacterized protein n=1 Tax=Musa troglodytarum TaxID=320322 RepID=A0A9E7EEA9_9LILI|nr:hypothetical protein MUK42_34209 [Musa troglodytarum]
MDARPGRMARLGFFRRTWRERLGFLGFLVGRLRGLEMQMRAGIHSQGAKPSTGHPWLLSRCRPSGASFWCGRWRHGPVGQSGPESDSENDLQSVLNDNDHRPLDDVRNDSIGKEYEDDC